jgi:hypothetical protein
VTGGGTRVRSGGAAARRDLAFLATRMTSPLLYFKSILVYKIHGG